MRKSLALAVAAPLAISPLLATPASAQVVVKQKKLEANIERGFKQQAKITVVAKCPKRVTWVKGKTFTCKVTDANGTKAKVLVTLRSGPAKGRLTWEKI